MQNLGSTKSDFSECMQNLQLVLVSKFNANEHHPREVEGGDRKVSCWRILSEVFLLFKSLSKPQNYDGISDFRKDCFQLINLLMGMRSIGVNVGTGSISNISYVFMQEYLYST